MTTRTDIHTYLWVPATFWDDHQDRCPSDDGDAGLCEEVRRSGNRVYLCGTAAQIECLRSDAAFYSHRDGPDETPRSIVNSAKRTLEAIAKEAAK